MQVSQRMVELDPLNQKRRGHAPQISISDNNHHVTEAFWGIYDYDSDGDDGSHDHPRPLSSAISPHGESIDSSPRLHTRAPSSLASRNPFIRNRSHDRIIPAINLQTAPKMMAPHAASFGDASSPMSPPRLTRTPSDTAQQHFPLNDIDYESSPAAVAQEISNLQAIRRMSMDVNASDPDLPAFSGAFIPPMAPSHDDDEDSSSRIYWVPARLHPELAPKDYKSFVQDRVDRARRRSGGGSEDSLSPDISASSSLRRKKSMLSRQINDGTGYKDGAERLERKRSQGQPTTHQAVVNLQELENLVNDPAQLVRRLSLDAARRSIDSDSNSGESDDTVLLPKAPGPSLKRSTRTTYRRGSLRKDPFSKRIANRQSDADSEISIGAMSTASNHAEQDSDSAFTAQPLQRVQTEPALSQSRLAENFSRPARRARSPPLSMSASDEFEKEISQYTNSPALPEEEQPRPRQFHSRIASQGSTTASLPGVPVVPQIIEPPPHPNESPRLHLPERKSSHEPPPQQAVSPPHSAPPQGPLPSRPGGMRVTPGRRQHASPSPEPTLDEMAAHPSMLPINTQRTDNLSIIPTLSEDKKFDRKVKKEAGETRKTSSKWSGWFGSGDAKDKENEEAKKSKKLAKPNDKVHDSTRLDVLQTSIEGGGRGRESLVLDRDSVRLEREREKEREHVRKVSTESRGGKDGGFFSLFGAGKKKAEKEEGRKKGSSLRGLSPEPPPRVLRPDIDYNWTRFSILEERAIYRMAHIKLANPRRELYSQVLLSNFMYSYLAKVQQMHPQMMPGANKMQQGMQQQQPQQQQQQQQQQSHQLSTQQNAQQQGHPQQQQYSQDQPDEYTQYQRYQMLQASQEGSNQPRTGQHPPTDFSDILGPSVGDQQYQHQQHQLQQRQQPSKQPPPKSSAKKDRRDAYSAGMEGGGKNLYTVASGQHYLGQANRAGGEMW